MCSRAWSYVKGDSEEDLVIICRYVDDLLVTGSNPESINEFKRVMEVEFEMTDLGRLSYFLGMEFSYTAVGSVLHKRKYAGDLLKRFNMMECNVAKSPMEANLKLTQDDSEKDTDETKFKQIVGSLRFLCNSRPNLALCVGVISRFMSKPKESHMQAAKRVLRYIKGAVNCGVLFGRKKTVEEITGYTNSDYGADPIEKKHFRLYLHGE
ncbi:uncharacterized protein LOC106773487 [Vigna radiata var. radiata]|uniref:Uncharacterized protein LOC106773487 n=1 Tax=Vigna radiata var. radiata TaxID=3916 RepID=A0A1S3VBC6_VIGRR|nr:uncharacterized protein LOC106773487 [Vigna radiata var. radiata]